jgi:cytochrome c oxidase assembly protein subunit 23
MSKADEIEQFAPPETNAKPLNYREQFQGRHSTSQFIDPCEAAAKASMDCMNRNDYKRDKCVDFFQVYKDCKKTWVEQRKADRRAGRPTT